MMAAILRMYKLYTIHCPNIINDNLIFQEFVKPNFK